MGKNRGTVKKRRTARKRQNGGVIFTGAPVNSSVPPNQRQPTEAIMERATTAGGAAGKLSNKEEYNQQKEKERRASLTCEQRAEENKQAMNKNFEYMKNQATKYGSQLSTTRAQLRYALKELEELKKNKGLLNTASGGKRRNKRTRRNKRN